MNRFLMEMRACFQMLFGTHGRDVENEPLKRRRWRLLQVEPAIACNLRCVMCPWKKEREAAGIGGVMTEDTWSAIKPHLPEVVSLDLTGGGEPLLQPKLPEWIADGKTAGCETGFLTNGLLLTERMSRELISAGLDWICISVDGARKETYEAIRVGSNFEKVCENISRVAAIRDGGKPKLVINFVLMHTNFHEGEELIRLAARLGVDQVNFKQCDVVRGAYGRGHCLFAARETKEVRLHAKTLAKARKLGKSLNIATTAFSFTPQELPVCPQDPRDSLFIRFDGAVAPCINLAVGGPSVFLGRDVTMPTVHYGRLPGRTLLELFETDVCVSYRKRFEERMRVYEQVYMEALTGSFCSAAEKLHEKTAKSMPDAPHGCNVCHYLYDV